MIMAVKSFVQWWFKKGEYINMKYEIEYEETIKRINSVTIEVEDEDEGEDIADELYEKARDFFHPDDIFAALTDMGVKVVETCKGAEECEYEIQ